MRFSILSLYSDPIPLAIASKSHLLSYASILSIPLPSESFSGFPSLIEIVPLVLAAQQYTLGCLFRSEMTGKDVGKRAEVVMKALEGPGNALEWKTLFDQAVSNRALSNGSEEEVKADADFEMVKKRIDSMMTSMFGTLTKGCVAVDTFACEHFFLPYSSLSN